MIKNDRQYRVTKAQLKAFEQSLEQSRSAKPPSDIDPTIVEAHKRALRSQHDELHRKVEEYEALQKGDVVMFEIDDLAELPRILIKARIASNLTQKDLAKRLGVKEQQVQRWEANDYSGASLATLRSVMACLGVEIRKEIFIPSKKLRAKAFLDYLERIGLPLEFFLKRIVSAADAARFRKDKLRVGLREIITAASRIARVFKADVHDLLQMRPIHLLSGPIPAARFKLISKRRPELVNPYVVYAHYVAGLVERCTPDLKASEFPWGFHEFHAALTKQNEPMAFRHAIEFLWDHGVVVLPMREVGLFHGAVWKIRNRPVIILKQSTSLESRWLYDLLHEFAHLLKGHVTDDVAVIEEQPISPEVEDPQEEEANEWAEDAIFDGNSDAIEAACAKECGGNLQLLKQAVPKVAARFNVNCGALANHMAYRLASEHKDWWGAAHNLQEPTADQPFETARAVLVRRADFDRLNKVDRDLLMRALGDN
jgi:transcriptional regulator with XRE-family HTH domain